jgi:hypothetical protein
MQNPCEELPEHLRHLCCGESPKLPARHCVQHFAAWKAQHKTVSPPSLFSQAKSFLSSFVAHIRNGLQPTPQPLHELRQAICAECDKFDAATSKCAECGCNMPLKWRWAASKCPIGKWEGQ